MELFKIKTGRYSCMCLIAAAPMIADLLGGQIQVTMNGKSVLLPHIRDGKLRPIA